MTPQLRNPVANKLQLSDVSDPESVLDDIVISLFWVEYYTYMILFYWNCVTVACAAKD